MADIKTREVNKGMRNGEDDPTTILNRCNTDEYKYSIEWIGLEWWIYNRIERISLC